MAADCAKTTIFAKQINTLPKRITIHNDRLQTVQKVTAIATILIPFVGTVIAIGSLKVIGCSLPVLMLMATLYAFTMLGITVWAKRVILQ